MSSVMTHEHEKLYQPRILSILSRGEALRNFVYSGVLDQLARESHLSVLSVIPNQQLHQLLVEKYGNIETLDDYPDTWLPDFIRDILDMAHGRRLWSEASKERWRLRDRESVSIFQKLIRFWKKIVILPFLNEPGLQFLSRLESAVSLQFRTSDRYLTLLKKLQPDLIFNSSHVHGRVAMPVIHAARALNIPTATFIFSWDNLTSQGRIIPSYDYYLVWNDALKQQLLKMYPRIHPDCVFVTGTPQFDFHFRPEYTWSRDEFCQRVGADPARPIVLYTTGMANHMPGEPDIVEGIADMLGAMTEFGPPQLLVRVYPKDHTGRFNELKNRRKDILFPRIPWELNWSTPLPEDMYMLTNMLRHAAVGINIASTVSLELCMFRKPAINIGYNPPKTTVPVDFSRYYEFDHYRPIVASAAVSVAWTEQQLQAQLIKILNGENTAFQAQKKLIESFFGDTLDGKSGERVANVLIQLARKNI